MRKQAGISLTAVGAVVALTLAACGGADSDGGAAADDGGETFTFKVADWLPPQHLAVTEGTQPWMDRVEELTDGRVDFEYFPAEQLGPAKDLLSLTRSGVADIAMINAPYTPELLQLSSVGGLPGLAQTSCENSWGFYEATKPGSVIYEQEYKPLGLHPLFPQGTAAYELMTADREVSSPEDAKGLTIALSGGAISRIAEALAAAPVSMGTPDRYDALQRGTVDSTLLGFTSVKTYSLEEVIAYSTDGAGLGASIAPYTMTTETWDALPEDIQEAFDQAAQESIDQYCAAMDSEAEAGKEAMADAGVTIVELSDEEKQAFTDALSSVVDAWVNEDVPAEKRQYAEQAIEEFAAGVAEHSGS